MSTTMADGASERLDAQIADALFGQPGMSKMDVANRLRELRGESGPLLVDAGNPVRPSPADQGDELLERVARFLDYSVGHDPWPNIRRVYGDAWWEPVRRMRDDLRALAAFQPMDATGKDFLTVGGGEATGND